MRRLQSVDVNAAPASLSCFPCPCCAEARTTLSRPLERHVNLHGEEGNIHRGHPEPRSRTRLDPRGLSVVASWTHAPTPNLGHSARLFVSGGWVHRLCRTLPRPPRPSAGRRLGRIDGIPRCHHRHLPPPSAQLGAVAGPRLDRLPRRHQRPRTASTRRAQRASCHLCLDSLQRRRPPLVPSHAPGATAVNPAHSAFRQSVPAPPE